jgi:hypothetical protein
MEPGKYKLVEALCYKGFRLTQQYFNSFNYFIQIIRYMFRSYDHLHLEIYIYIGN